MTGPAGETRIRWCRDCADRPPSDQPDDPTLCHLCNAIRREDLLAWYDEDTA